MCRDCERLKANTRLTGRHLVDPEIGRDTPSIARSLEVIEWQALIAYPQQSVSIDHSPN